MSFRKRNIDRDVVKGLLAIAKDLKLDEVFIYSPLDDVEYFRKFNFISAGAVFMEAGMPRQRMTCAVENIKKSTRFAFNH
jgi:N-acetylglutamate synthase-like GNAT family acetyltransferase